ncbi:hypothetical protein OPT61_g9479 [Boeremia exigua]|uniref:Uncharacterized protein n=1 Tax=Boeremia exigua TaxID=749465 RepID=A0ACC2HTX4_9PLEO|nr:hypothetical protein OPT61_g9479 [Boeremia exigua]
MASDAGVERKHKRLHKGQKLPQVPRATASYPRSSYASLLRKQRQLTTGVPHAMDLAVAQNLDSGVSARFGATPVLRRAAPSHDPWLALCLLQHGAALWLLRDHDVYRMEAWTGDPDLAQLPGWTL